MGVIPPEIRDLDIVVVAPPEGCVEALIRALQRTRNPVRTLWPAPDLLPANVDVIFCELMPELPARLPWVPGEPAAALVVLLPADAEVDLDLLRKTAPEAILHRPFTPQATLASLTLARSRFAYERRLRGRLDKLDATLRAMRNVERAKAILMATRKLSEDEAYAYLRRQAMQRRVPVGSVAAAIVDAGELIL